jgi:ParB-like chromosome segregation protein Spo0J
VPLVPVVVLATKDRRQLLQLAMDENIYRTDLNAFDLATAFFELTHDLGLTTAEVAQRYGGKSTEYVLQHLRLLVMHREVQESVRLGRITFADAREMQGLEPEDQADIMHEMLAAPKKPTSRQFKEKVRQRRVSRRLQATIPASTEETATASEGDVPNASPKADDDGFARGLLLALQKAEEIHRVVAERPDTASGEIEAVISELLGMSEGEDIYRDWARRLSRAAATLLACAKKPTEKETIVCAKLPIGSR